MTDADETLHENTCPTFDSLSLSCSSSAAHPRLPPTRPGRSIPTGLSTPLRRRGGRPKPLPHSHCRWKNPRLAGGRPGNFASSRRGNSSSAARPRNRPRRRRAAALEDDCRAVLHDGNATDRGAVSRAHAGRAVGCGEGRRPEDAGGNSLSRHRGQSAARARPNSRPPDGKSSCPITPASNTPRVRASRR